MLNELNSETHESEFELVSVPEGEIFFKFPEDQILILLYFSRYETSLHVHGPYKVDIEKNNQFLYAFFQGKRDHL